MKEPLTSFKRGSKKFKNILQCYKIAFSVLFLCASDFVNAQITAPSVPTVSAPSSIAPVTIQPIASLSSATNQTAPAKKTSSSNVSAASLASLATSLFNGGTEDGALSSFLGGANRGIFSGASNAPNTTANPAATILLEQILAQLADIQNKLANVPAATQPVSYERSDTQQNAAETAKILRFSVNNYSVLDTCRTVFFSKRGNDGSFLLTGDRKYLSDGKTRDETFYLLFKKNGLNKYDVACTVSQDYENTFSFLYQLSYKNNLCAQQTGNFITVRVNEPAWKLDLLIDASDLGTY